MKKPADYFSDGYSSNRQGLPETACPLRFKGWPYHCWQLGWQYGELERKVSNGDYANQPLDDNDKTPFGQGQVAHMKGVAFADVPYEGADARAWQLGWISQEPASGIDRKFIYGLLWGTGLSVPLWLLIMWAIYTFLIVGH
jgi:hypothetical protein